MGWARLELGERVLPVDLGHAQGEGRVRERRVVPVDEDRADALRQVCRDPFRVRVEPRVRGSHHAPARVLDDRGHGGLSPRGGRGRGALTLARVGGVLAHLGSGGCGRRRRVHDVHAHGRQVGRQEG